jgi:hypothetical protein
MLKNAGWKPARDAGCERFACRLVVLTKRAMAGLAPVMARPPLKRGLP